MSNPNNPTGSERQMTPSARLLNELSRLTMRYNLMGEGGMEVFDVLASPPGELRPVYDSYFPTHGLEVDTRLIQPKAQPDAAPKRLWSVEYIPNWVTRREVGDSYACHRINFWQADGPSQTVAKTIFNVVPSTGGMRALLELEIGEGQRTEERAARASEFIAGKVVQTYGVPRELLPLPEYLASSTWKQMTLEPSSRRIAFDAILKIPHLPARNKLKRAVAARLSQL